MYSKLMKAFCLLLVSLLATSCTTGSKDLKKLIRPWSKELSREEPYKYPFIARYKKNDFQLHFVAADHSNELYGPTFKTIKKEFLTLNPDVVILESFAYEKGQSPKFFIDYTQRCQKSQFKRCGEASYAVFLIGEKHIPFFGGEPSDRKILEEALKNGFDPQDVVFFYTLRQIPQLKRQGRIESDFVEQFNRITKGMANRLGVKGDFNFDGFKRWYLGRLSKELEIYKIDTEEVAPYGDDNALFTQKISHVISLFRDQFVVELIKNKSAQYKRILIVYGGSHHAKQRLALEELFGPAQYVKAF